MKIVPEQLGYATAVTEERVLHMNRACPAACREVWALVRDLQQRAATPVVGLDGWVDMRITAEEWERLRRDRC